MDAMIETNPPGPALAKGPYVATEADIKAVTAQVEKRSAPTAEQLAAQKRATRAAYYGIRPGTKGKGTPEVFEDDPKPPVFHYEYLTATEKQDFFDLFSDGLHIVKGKTAEAARWILDRKLTGWEGFTTARGVEIPFNRGHGDQPHLAQDCWDSIPIPLRADLMSMILSANEMDGEETQGVKS